MKKNILLLGLIITLTSTLISCSNNKDSSDTDTLIENTNNTNDIESNNSAWDIQIKNIRLENELVTDEYITLYDGNVQSLTHENLPSENSSYLLLNLSVEKIETLDSNFSIDEITLSSNDDGNIYTQSDNSFLNNHKMTPFTKNELRVGSSQGYVVFEVPSNFDVDKANLVWNNAEIKLEIAQPDYSILETNMATRKNYIEEQWEIEQQILQDYKLNQYSHENPYIIIDPYQWSPLVALALFETEQPATISIKVIGKDEYSHIEHHFDELNTFHQIPIIGLYADYENTVEITANYQDGSTVTNVVDITTEALLNDNMMSEVHLIESKPELMENGLTFLALGGSSKNAIIVDHNAEIRWTLNHQTGQIFKRISNGNMLIKNVYALGVFEMDLLGKIYGDYNAYQPMHHDVIELPNGNILTCSSASDIPTGDGARILELDRTTGEIIHEINFEDILDATRFNANEKQDWFHINTLWYEETDKSLIVSGRYQGVAKISYPEGELQWFLTLDEALDGIDDKVLTPIGENFKPPVGQHSPMMIPNQDGNLDTIDILVWDNNNNSGMTVTQEHDDNRKYSRAVQYRINEKELTVEEIWSYGEELGYEYFGTTSGDADYMSNGNIFTVFGDRELTMEESNYVTHTGTIIEVVKDTKEIAYQIDVFTADMTQIYRAERLPLYPEVWNYELASTKGEYKARNHQEEFETEFTYELTTPYEVNGEITHDFEPSFNNNYTQKYLDVNGYMTVPSVNSTEYSTSIIIQSETKALKIGFNLQENTTKGDNLNLEYGDEIDYSLNKINVALPMEELFKYLSGDRYTIGVLVEGDGFTSYQKGWGYFDLPETSYNNVEVYDIIDVQNIITEQIFTEYESSNYNLDNPFTTVDPFGISPLSAITLFETDKPAQISIEVAGLNGGDTISHSYTDYNTNHQIPILGLYPKVETTVTLTATFQDGSSQTNSFMLAGDALPDDFTAMNVDKSTPSEMAYGLTFYIHQHLDRYFNAIDSKGDVRFVTNIKSLGLTSGLEMLENGNLLVVSEKETHQYYKNSFYEMDLTGKIYGEFLLENVHHDITEGNNGNFLALGNDINGEVLEDTVYEIDRNTGEIVKYWDLDDYLHIDLYNDNGERISNEVRNSISHDWLHLNAIDQHPTTNELLLSGRNHDIVFSIDYDTGEVNYILGDHSVPLTDDLQDKLLTPIGDEFEWFYGQHNAQFLENGDILIFDNGSFRSKTFEEQTDAVTQGYSRGVIYRVNQDDMTIEQVWQYGKELGSSHLSTYLSGIQFLDDNHFIINFGGLVFNENGDICYVILDGANGSSASIQYEVKNGEIIFATSYETTGLDGNTYRVERHNPYQSKTQPNFNVDSNRLGTLPNRNLVQEITFPTDDSLNLYNSSVLDNGVQLVYTFALENNNTDDVAYLVFVSDNSCYQIPLSQGSSPSGAISHSNIPKGTYDLWISYGDKSKNLLISWDN